MGHPKSQQSPSKPEVRSGSSGTKPVVDGAKLSGYAATFDDWYDVGGWFQERIAKGAFDDVLNDDVLALTNHNDVDIPVGRTSAGTLRLFVDEKGLRYELDTPDSPLGKNLAVAVERGDISQSSLSFTVDEESWDFSGPADRRTILKMKRLWDVSPVNRPANPNTDVAVRSRDAARHADLAMRARRLRALQLKRRN